MTDDIIRRIERLENRLNETERNVAAVTSELHSVKEDLTTRISDVKIDLKTDIATTRTDIRERIEHLRLDLKDDIITLSSTIDSLQNSVKQVTDAIQNLYLTQNTANVKVSANERIIWAVVSIAVTAGLYFLQAFVLGVGGS
ncbi:MAG: hypothetical protein DRQ47_04525 [Gammaproteobacteria bacterium]|nr:MAG: hypothetical protein DRQ47_04525 [Gammaproteobacteria bacterium]